MKKNENETVGVSEETAIPIKSSKTVSSEQFAGANVLELMSLNDDLNSLNKGEVRFSVSRLGNYEFPKTDKDGKVIIDLTTGQPEMIISPYADVTGEGFSGRMSTKLLAKEDIQKLEQGKKYIGTYILINVNNAITPSFISVVPYAEELQVRTKYLQQGA